MEKKSSKKGCCHDEYKIVKAKTVAVFTNAPHTSDTFNDALLPLPAWNCDHHKVAVVAQQTLICGTPHRPPLPNNVRLYVRHCVFLI
ncbi:MAG: hypothetical protein ABI378_04445 [Chitinophagaceae bacterium]